MSWITRAVLVIALLAVALPATAQAQVTRDERYSLFKRTLSPAWVRGANGYVTAPSAHTLGHLNVAASAFVTDSGTVNVPGRPGADQVYTSRFSAFVGTSDDVELGATKKVLTYDDWTREGINIQADILHFKARVLKLTEWLPVVGVGANATEVTADNYQTKETFVDVYAVATETIRWRQLWLNGSVGIQKGLLGDLSSENYLFAAAQVKLTRYLLFGAEVVGASQRTAQSGTVKLGTDALLNLTAAIILPVGRANLQLGADAYNAAQSLGGPGLSTRAEDIEWGVHVSFTLPLGGLFGKGGEEE